MRYDIDSVKLYVRIKWWVLLLVGIYVFAGVFLKFLGQQGPWLIYAFILALGISFLDNIFLLLMIRWPKLLPAAAYTALLIDLLVIVLITYAGGGIENSWYFLPVIIIIAGGFLFGVIPAYVLAAISFSMMLGVYLLEYHGLIPHLSPYGLSETVIKNPDYFTDYVAGVFILYFIGASMSGFFKKNLAQASGRLEKSLEEIKSSHLAQVKILKDLETAKKELEDKIKEVEDSRRATLHLLQDVEDSRQQAKNRTEEITKLYEELKVADRLKTEFLAMVSHELRTPMTPIKGYTSMLLNGQLGEMKPEQNKVVGIIQKQSDHMLELVDNILDVSRLVRRKKLVLEKEPLMIKKLTDELVEVMQPEADFRKISLKARLSQNLPTIIADYGKLHRVLTNIIGNALKFTPKGGEIKITAAREGDQVRIEVIDNGLGIEAENLQRIFDQFYQVDSSYTRTAGGMGLGLSIAREIVEAHGGRIWAESEGLGKGTKLCFTLPIS